MAIHSHSLHAEALKMTSFGYLRSFESEFMKRKLDLKICNASTVVED